MLRQARGWGMKGKAQSVMQRFWSPSLPLGVEAGRAEEERCNLETAPPSPQPAPAPASQARGENSRFGDLRYVAPTERSADFQVCCIAGFPTCSALLRPPDWKSATRQIVFGWNFTHRSAISTRSESVSNGRTSKTSAKWRFSTVGPRAAKWNSSVRCAETRRR